MKVSAAAASVGCFRFPFDVLYKLNCDQLTYMFIILLTEALTCMNKIREIFLWV